MGTVCWLMGKFPSKLIMYWLHFCAHMSSDMAWFWLLWINSTKFRVVILAQLKVVPIRLLSSEKSGHQLRHLSELSKLPEYAEMVSQQSTLGFLILSLKSEMHLQEFLSCGYFPVGRSLSFCDLWSCFSVLVGIFSKISDVSCLKCHSSCSLLGLGLSRLIAGISARWCAYSQWHRNHCRLFHPCLAMSCSRQGTGSGLGGW